MNQKDLKLCTEVTCVCGAHGNYKLLPKTPRAKYTWYECQTCGRHATSFTLQSKLLIQEKADGNSSNG